MGSAWCKNRAASTDDSKSTVGRVIVRCVNQMCPAQKTDPAAVPRPESRLDEDKQAGFQLWGTPRAAISPPLPERPPPGVSSSAWQSAVLTVPEPEPPVPPPRTKRRRRRRYTLARSASLAARPAPEPVHGLRRAGSACELSPAVVDSTPRLVFDFTSYNSTTARTPPPSPARDKTPSRDILEELGLPSTLRGDADKLAPSRASSGRSSMTPSLSELEAALSDLLEAGAARNDDDEEADPITRTTATFRPPSALPKEVVA